MGMIKHVHKKFSPFRWIGVILFLCLLVPIVLFFVAQQQAFKADVKHISVEGQDVAYYLRGNGPPLMLLNGFGMTMQDWDPLFLEHLSKKHQLIILDYPATGASKDKVFPENQQALAQTIVGVMDKLEIRKTSLLGWSLGSFVAQMVAAQYPNRIDQLILVSTAPGGKAMIGASDEVSQSIEKHMGGTWESTYVPYLFPKNATQERDDYLKRRKEAIENGQAPQTPHTALPTLMNIESVFGDEKQETLRNELLHEIEAPTLIIAGEKDVLIPLKNNTNVAKQIPNAVLVPIPNAGHGVLFQGDTNVTTAIDTFLKP